MSAEFAFTCLSIKHRLPIQSDHSGQIDVIMRTWQIQEAKAHLSELVKETERGGPQAITWHGHAVAVVLSKAEYERLTGTGHSLVEFMRRSPLFGGDDIDLSRDASLTRDVAL